MTAVELIEQGMPAQAQGRYRHNWLPILRQWPMSAGFSAATKGKRQTVEDQRRNVLGKRSLLLPFTFCLLPFVLLCTLNSAGYRYGASDLAFYIPAALERIDPSLFPRDTPLIASQAKLTMIDETIAEFHETVKSLAKHYS